jgi:hypothetical protein
MGHEQLHNQGNSTLFINKQEQNKDRMTFPSLGKIPEWVDNADVKRHEMARIS